MGYQFKIGHTAITWPEDEIERAIADVSSLGYAAFECFGWTLERWEKERPGEYRAILDKYGLRQYSAYCAADIADAEQRDAEIERVITWGKLLKELGGSVVTLGGRRRKKPTYSRREYGEMARTVSELGRRLLDMGIECCFHQHTGTPVETQEEIYAFMEQVDPDAVFFGPDVGQIAKGGGDPIQVVRDFGPMIRHVHLKDFVGGKVQTDEGGKEIDPTGYLSYLPLGEGTVDIPAILDILAGLQYAGYVMVELDGTPKAPYPPGEAAAVSKRYLESLGQVFGGQG